MAPTASCVCVCVDGAGWGRGIGQERGEEGDAGSQPHGMEIAVSQRPGTWRQDENKISNAALKKIIADNALSRATVRSVP